MQEKKVRKIFNSISFRYDVANYFISLGVERYWRLKFLKMISGSEKKVLDACCGTGYSTIGIAGRIKNDAVIYGIDFSGEMLEIARSKAERYLYYAGRGQNIKIRFSEGDVTCLDFEDGLFDLITVVFGIRNVKDRKKALEEFHRVSSDKSRLLIMEFNYPQNKFIRNIYDFYLNFVMSNLGAMITGNKEAYSYLAESIRNFTGVTDFCRIIKDAGWQILKVRSMTFGVCTIYYAGK
ncbi:MAG TPA: bifunctional demethylmenaquinone methyltransferase/2-methoxy-6-polyprenyl-1,4-benzoquinol methylase UbiE [Actinobacteria bacterium]|nr:bifunctional demethylmenaquinone methyltransferase/2-methoxy-6-polyprenyl-1,4-benzoquinol methylase UbiE [Actinomycetota bacterium]